METAKSRFVKVPDLARAAEVANDTIYRLITSGQLPARKIGREYRIPLDAAEQLLGEPL